MTRLAGVCEYSNHGHVVVLRRCGAQQFSSFVYLQIVQLGKERDELKTRLQSMSQENAEVRRQGELLQERLQKSSNKTVSVKSKHQQRSFLRETLHVHFL